MPNVLDIEPMQAFAQRVAMKIDNDKVRVRFARMAFERLLSDPCNFRPALPAEIEEGPDWPRTAQARGESILVFKLNRGAGQRLHIVARRLAQTCKLAAMERSRPNNAVATIEARAFVDKFDRVSFEVAALKSRHFARMLVALEDSRDGEPLCQPGEIATKQGRVWRRVTSIAELRAVGCEFRNCLARAARDSSYVTMFRGQSAQFWVLRDAEGAGLIVAMAALPQPTRFTDVRGPRNAAVSAANADLACLSAALGIEALKPRQARRAVLHASAEATAAAVEAFHEWMLAYDTPQAPRRRVRRP